MSFCFVFLGLSVRSVWDNGHATTYRALLRALAQRGHEVVFLERDQPSFAERSDVDRVPWAQTHVYGSLTELFDRHASIVREADLVVVGSHIPDGMSVGRWALELAGSRVAFYDLDTPATIGALVDGTCCYLSSELVSRYALYLSSAGGPTLDALRRTHGAQWVRPLYCSVDTDVHFPEEIAPTWDLGYLGTADAGKERRAGLERLLVEPARVWKAGRFVVAGADQANTQDWPTNIARRGHLTPSEHRRFYCAQRFSLNVTGQATLSAGWSPSVRVFEAAACGTPIITDLWPGLDEFLVPGSEALVVRTSTEALRLLRELPEVHRIKVGEAARKRVLAEHTSKHRAETLERYTRELLERRGRRSRPDARTTW